MVKLLRYVGVMFAAMMAADLCATFIPDIGRGIGWALIWTAGYTLGGTATRERWAAASEARHG